MFRVNRLPGIRTEWEGPGRKSREDGQACGEGECSHARTCTRISDPEAQGRQIAEYGLFTLIRRDRTATLSSLRHLRTSGMSLRLRQVAFIFPDEDEP